MSFAVEVFSRFWAKSFGLQLDQMKSRQNAIVTAGSYVDRYGDQYIYLFHDLQTGKYILAGTAHNIQKIRNPSEIFEDGGEVNGFQCEYNDLDYILPSAQAFRAQISSMQFRELTSQDSKDLDQFYTEISEDEKDTLDLDLEKGRAFGIYQDKRLISVSCFFKLRDEPRIADLTVVTASRDRGQGYGSIVVSKVVECILKEELLPRYRVREDLKSSVSIAVKLGFSPRYQIKTFSRLM